MNLFQYWAFKFWFISISIKYKQLSTICYLLLTEWKLELAHSIIVPSTISFSSLYVLPIHDISEV